MTAVDERDDEARTLFALKRVAPTRTLAYGDHPSQVVDLYGDESARPVVALLHGGFWRERYDRGYLTPLAAALAADLGRCVALVEYRRVGRRGPGGAGPGAPGEPAGDVTDSASGDAAAGADGGGGFPATFDDLPPALAALPGAGPVMLVGHSAGGHLALWTASRCPTAVSRVVGVSPVADLARAHELGLSDGAVAELLGGAERVAERLDETDPMRMPAPAAPVVLLHGEADADVPVELSRRYAHAVGVHLRELPGTGHYAPVTPGTRAYEALLAALTES
ncbi:alpha/beta hydrolase-fold protein [Streptomyces sp. WMMC500]|uniref:alpha/beta hydrolase family protein n=1 Tax=Streptomyces sp. WMMC500 TaxID=3015154 RepID=UPI00248AF33B|nr:alpha/beta hydrolase-fold protein [Streptomyces sp. WMMC500]WBB64309.1 alpha/beta hydrolase-fold protein [Streptomyces sp. WMMC500]